MYKLKYLSLVLIFIATMGSNAVSARVLNEFTDRIQWNNSVGMGNYTTESFDSVTSHRQLQNNTLEDVGEFNVFYTTNDKKNLAFFDLTKAQSIASINGNHLTLSWDIDKTLSLELRFDSPINSFGANFSSIHFDSDLSMILDDEVVNLYDSLSGTKNFANGFLGFILENPVSSIAFTATNDSGLRMDDISLGNTLTAVPLPAGLWLLASALLSLIHLSRKDRTSAY